MKTPMETVPSLIFFSAVAIYSVIPSDIRLSKSKDTVLENSTLTLTCSRIDGKLVETRWETSTFPDQEAECGLAGYKCIKTLFLNNTRLYDCTCNGNGTYSVHFKRADRSQHGKKWSCLQIGSGKSNTVEVKVAVPVTHVILNQSGGNLISENKTSSPFKCTTAYSLPPATIHWYRSKGSSREELSSRSDGNVQITRTQYARYDNLISVEETLTYRVNRSVHGWNIFCNALNWENLSVTSKQIMLNVSYPPDQPPVIQNFSSGSTYKVIENAAASLSCSVEGGNPPAKLKWLCMNLINNTLIEMTDNTKVTSNLSWTAIRTDGKTCRCETDHKLWKTFTYVNVDVLYPPEIQTLQVQYHNNKTNVTEDVTLIENNTYRLNCKADGNPLPALYIWRGPQNLNKSTNGSLNLANVFKDHSGVYSCVAQNAMTPTYGDKKNGTNSRSVHVEILYKPTVDALSNRDVAEGSSVSVTCTAKSSNPNITDAVWTRDKNGLRNHSNPLLLQNISRNDSMNYTCTLKNKMEPTVGPVEEGQASDSFYLNVWYRASVVQFLVPGHEQENPVIANESSTIQFICQVDSNPDSNTTVISPNGKTLLSVVSNNMSYSHFLSSCHDRGNYTCSGSNKYNHRRPGNASLSLVVNCKPMAYYPLKEEEDIRSALYVPVTLQFTAIAYPGPEFTWEIWTNSSWNTLENNGLFSISSSEMKSNLTVRNFSSTVGMLFRLVVENFMGILTQNFTLQPFDRPDTPLDFSHVETFLTDTTVMLSWRPGFNGGLPQNFTIMHRREIDQEWNNLVFSDTGQELMNFTIRGLTRSTVYVFRIYAENMKNRSNILEITVTTKAAAVEKTPESNTLVVLIVGSLSGVLVISGVVVFGILLYRKRYTFKKKTATDRLLYQNVQFCSTKKSQNAKTLAKKETSFHPLHELDDTPPEYNMPTEYYRFPEKIEQMEKIRVPELLQYVSDRTEEAFAAEYQKLRTGLQKPHTFARKPENIDLNRYNGIYPYDHSRVRISGQPDFYINACYIHGYTQKNEFIASLGPTMKVTDNYKTFWMMVWSEQSDVIIMLTNLQEPSVRFLA